MIELHMFATSHFNEKARWALDFKGIPHQRTPYLPGPHARKIRKISGQEQTPVVRFDDGEVTSGSTAILLELEERFPEPRLIPTDAEQRREALGIVEMFDGDIAVKERRGLFVHLMEEPDYLCSMFSRGQPPVTRFIYRRLLPLVKGHMKKAMDIVPEAHEEGVAATLGALDFVAEKSSRTGYLVGDRFSIADLTAAALLAPSIMVSHPDMRKTEPVVPRIKAWMDLFADHPGAAWVRQTYDRHRPVRTGT